VCIAGFGYVLRHALANSTPLNFAIAESSNKIVELILGYIESNTPKIGILHHFNLLKPKWYSYISYGKQYIGFAHNRMAHRH
jgi:hypothetical protein